MSLRAMFEWLLRDWRLDQPEDHPWGYTSQQELERTAGYAPGGVDLSRWSVKPASDTEADVRHAPKDPDDTP